MVSMIRLKVLYVHVYFALEKIGAAKFYQTPILSKDFAENQSKQF